MIASSQSGRHSRWFPNQQPYGLVGNEVNSFRIVLVLPYPVSTPNGQHHTLSQRRLRFAFVLIAIVAETVVGKHGCRSIAKPSLKTAQK